MNEELIARVEKLLGSGADELHVESWPEPVARAFEGLGSRLDAERQGAGEQAYYYDEEISRLNHHVEELLIESYDKDQRIRDLEGDLYETQRQAERQRQESSRGW